MPKFDYAYFQAQLINKQIITPFVKTSANEIVYNEAPINCIKFYERIVAPVSDGTKDPLINPNEIGHWYIDVLCNKLYHWHCDAWHQACYKRVIVETSGFAADGTTVITSASDYANYAFHTNHCGHMCQVRWGIISDDLYEHIVAPSAHGCVNPIDNPSEIEFWRIHCNRLYVWDIRCEEWRHARCRKVFINTTGIAVDNNTSILSDSDYAGKSYETDSCGYLTEVFDNVNDEAKHLYEAHCDTSLTRLASGRYFNRLNRSYHNYCNNGVEAYELYQINTEITDGAYSTLPNFNGRTQYSDSQYGLLYCDREKWYRFNYITSELRYLRHEVCELWEAINNCCVLVSGSAPALQAKLTAAKAALPVDTAPANPSVDASENTGPRPNANVSQSGFDGQDDTEDNTTPKGTTPDASKPADQQDSLPQFNEAGDIVDASGNPI